MLNVQSVVKKDYILTFSLQGLSKEPTIRTAIDGEKLNRIFKKFDKSIFFIVSDSKGNAWLIKNYTGNISLDCQFL